MKTNLKAIDNPTDAIDSKKIKGYVDRIMNLKDETADINSEIKSIYDAAADAGYDRAALKDLIKHKRKELSQEHKQNVNQLCLAIDMPLIYKSA